jgi:hypothetical protein
MADACSIQDPQGAITLGTPFLGIKRVVRRATQGPIRLRSKRRTGKAMGKGGTCELRRAIGNRRRGRLRCFRLVGRGSFDFESRGKLGRAQFGWRELLPQFKSKVPNPLSKDLGKLLTAGGMRVPSVGFLLVIFIGKHCLKRPAMQVEVKHIRSGKCQGGKCTDKQFVDRAVPLDADCWRRGGGIMCRDDHTHFWSGWGQGNGWAIVQGSHHPAFRMGAYVVWSTEKARFHDVQIQ